MKCDNALTIDLSLRDILKMGEEAIIRCGTTKGDITLKFIREWSPNGYDKAVELFERHYYDHSHFFRAVPKFLVQFGISYSEDQELVSFGKRQIKDDPKHDPPIEFHPGIISYAGSGPNSRTSQLFISYGSAKSLGRELWETPIGKVIEGMDVAEQFYSYGDMPPWGKGPVQGKIYNGPKYIEDNFPLIDKFLECEVERTNSGEESPSGSDDEKAGSTDDGEKSSDADLNEGGNDDVAHAMDDPMNGTGAPKEKKNHYSDRSEQKIDKFYAVPQGLHEKSLRLRGNFDSNSFAFPAGVIFVMVLLTFILRGRGKISAKEN